MSHSAHSKIHVSMTLYFAMFNSIQENKAFRRTKPESEKKGPRKTARKTRPLERNSNFCPFDAPHTHTFTKRFWALGWPPRRPPRVTFGAFFCQGRVPNAALDPNGRVSGTLFPNSVPPFRAKSAATMRLQFRAHFLDPKRADNQSDALLRHSNFRPNFGPRKRPRNWTHIVVPKNGPVF